MTRANRSWIRAEKVEEDGYVFDSKAEYRRYRELKLLEKAGEIFDLKVHVEHRLELNGKPLLIRSDGYPNGRRCKYTSDFEYIDRNANKVIEDVKGYATPHARYRIGVFELLTGHRVTIVR
jgi:hypothetical protein